MKKTLFTIVFYALFCAFAAVSSLAQDIPNEFLYMEGSAVRQDQLEFFLTNFKIEAAGAGYTITETRNEAAFTFRFIISQNTVIDSGGNRVPAPPDDNQFVMRISLIKNAGSEEILTFDFYFTELLEMYEHTFSIFHRAVIYIPPSVREVIVEKEVVVEVEREVEVLVEGEIDRSWQNRWLYINLSVDYPISFYQLQPTGLKGANIGVYSPGGLDENGEEILADVMPLDHKIIPQPGMTLGLEFQFLNFMSLEINFQANIGDPRTYYFVNLFAGAELKFAIKTKYFMIQPYLGFLYPLNVSDEFKEFPLFAAGGGLEVGVRGGKLGAFFLNVNFMYFFGDVYRHNPYDPLFSEPPVIHYKRFNLGLGIGYKFGLIERRPRVRTAAQTESEASE